MNIIEEKLDYRLPHAYTINADNWSLTLATSKHGATIYSGSFGEFSVLASELFSMRLKYKKGNITTVLSSDGWDSVKIEREDGRFRILFDQPNQIANMSVELIGYMDPVGISWYANVVNHSPDYTVENITYPTPALSGEVLHLFTPDRCGRAMMNAGDKGFQCYYDYPGFHLSMQYFAFWGNSSGLYLGIHDPDACMKKFHVVTGNHEARLTATFPAIGASTMANSFSAGGYMRWEVYTGDWYDATLIYRNFVYQHANWLPKKGRPDTAQKFKEIALWANYNGKENFHEDCLNGVLKIREAIGHPIATHPYNWHQIKFDTDYPHFMPANNRSVEAFRAFQEAGVYVIPYINGVSWETLDAESGYEMNYENTGIHGVAINPDGTRAEVQYRNLKPSGAAVRLAPMCPGFMKWHTIMQELVRDMEANLPIDGVYFDQVAAVTPVACISTEHEHTPGGGSYWAELYNRMIHTIKKDRPQESFYYTECNGEAYTNSFDGVLSWQWNTDDLVPAYSVIYAGYIQMVGRSADGGDDVFRYHFAQAVMYGQQPGWFHASSHISQDRLDFMKQAVDVRLAYIDLFNNGSLLRPPVIQSDLKDLNTPKGVLKPIIAQIWQSADKSQTVLFVANISDKDAAVTIQWRPREYGFECDDTVEMALSPKTMRAIVLNTCAGKDINA